MLLAWLKKQNFPVPPFIIMTSYADIQSAVLAMKSGASDYIAKPFNPEALLIKINELLQQKTELSSVNNHQNESSAKAPAPPRFMEGKSEQARQLYEYIRLVAPTDIGIGRVLCPQAKHIFTGEFFLIHCFHASFPPMLMHLPSTSPVFRY